MTTDKRVCLGAFAGAHGVRGETKVKVFTAEPDGISAYGPVETEDRKRRFTLTVIRQMKGEFVLVRAPEIKSREDAESLKGSRLYIDRDALPAPEEDEFYLDDLVGLRAEDETGAPLGSIKAVYNFGADDMIELTKIPGIKGVRLVPFTKAMVPEVDIAGGRVVVARVAIDPEDPAPEPQKS
ncbi:ribosome maturation factor RimM [Hyphococcus formosus]|uniref:ribosome maturation factor RimM n=1 Tax=Hyphococcus formosus TaxID=3143534 RepID=UPI00398B7623